MFDGSGVREFTPYSRTLEHPNVRTLFRLEACLTSIRCLAAYYFCYFAAVGVFEPYLAPLWRQTGFSPAQIGLLNSIMPGVGVFGPFLWTAYADATRKGERIFLLNTWITALMALLIPQFDRFAVVAVVILFFAFFRTPLISPANSMTFRALAGRREGFGVFYLAAVQTVDTLVPDGLRASAQGLLSSITFGVGGLAGNTLAGLLYEPLGMAWLYGAAALLSAGSTLLYWVGTARSIRGEPLPAAPLPGGKLR